jgi:hypothetical protein
MRESSWDVERGKTQVELSDGTLGVIKDGYGGFFFLTDIGSIHHRSEITKWSN